MRKEPKKAAGIAANAKGPAIFQFTDFFISKNLNRLFEKCTIAVHAIANNGSPNNKIKTGVNRVPKPKPL